jgi:hypothetical protein
MDDILSDEADAAITGCVQCPGHALDHSLYRSELAGIYAVLTIATKLCEFYHIREGKITIGCDGLSALSASIQDDPFLASDISNFDLISAIYTLRRSTSLAYEAHLVKGHQDNTSTELDYWATLNVQMDQLAKKHMAYVTSLPRFFQ